MSKDKKEKADKEVEEVIEAPVAEASVLVDIKTGETVAKAAFRKKIEAYEKANPEAWKIRGDRLLAKLDLMV